MAQLQIHEQMYVTYKREHVNVTYIHEHVLLIFTNM